jgi:hypothetical protein
VTITKETQIAFIFLLATLVFICYKQSYLHRDIHPYMFAHYFFNYQDEFIKRGLVGECLRILNIDISQANMKIFANGVLTLCALATFFLLGQALKLSPRAIGLWLFSALFIVHSATLQRFMYDLGRSDQIIFLLALIALAVIYKIKRWFAYPIVLALMAIAIAIHEGAFLMFVPLVVCFWLYIDRAKYIVPKIVVFIALIALTAFVGTNGFITKRSFEEHCELLNKTVPKVCVNSGVTAINTIHDRIDYKTEGPKRLFDSRTIKEHGKLLLYLTPLFFLVWKTAKSANDGGGGASMARCAISDYRKWRILFLLLIISAFSPLCLYLFGWDFYRWHGLAINNLFIVLALVAIDNANFRAKLSNVFYNYQLVAIVTIILSVWLRSFNFGGAEKLFI